MTLGGIPVTDAVRLAAFHHALQDGPLEEIPQLLELLASLAEARIGGVGEGASRGHGPRFSRIYPTVILQYDKSGAKTFLWKRVTFARRPSSASVWDWSSHH